MTYASSCIYEIRNIKNGKFYIGSTVNFQRRISVHMHGLTRGIHGNRHLQSSFNKHGKDAFSVNVLLICAREHLLFYEQLALDGLKPDYNILKTAGSPRGTRHTPETIEKMKLAIRNRTKEEWIKIIASRKKHVLVHTDETKIKISRAQSGRIKTADEIRRIGMTVGSFNADQVYEMRGLSCMGYSNREIADKFSAAYSVVYNITRRKTYAWL